MYLARSIGLCSSKISTRVSSSAAIILGTGGLILSSEGLLNLYNKSTFTSHRFLKSNRSTPDECQYQPHIRKHEKKNTKKMKHTYIKVHHLIYERANSCINSKFSIEGRSTEFNNPSCAIRKHNFVFELKSL